MKMIKNKKVLLLSSVFLITSSLYAQEVLVKQLGKKTNKPPYVNDKNLITATYPNSKITITLNAVDPENNGVYTVLVNGNSVGDGITCQVKNAVQIICNVPDINLTKNDVCMIHSLVPTDDSGKAEVHFCKSYKIKYYLKDGGYENLAPAVSPTYTLTLRVAHEVNSSLTQEPFELRGFANSLMTGFSGVASYNKNSIQNIMPDSMQKQYDVALQTNDADAANLGNDKLINNSIATTALSGSISGTHTDKLLSYADTITTGTAVSSAPIYCTIKRAGFFNSPAYVCTLDPELSVSPDLAVKYSYIDGDSYSQNYALQQCQSACVQNIQCNDVSGDVYTDLITDKNYITDNLANQNYLDKNYGVKKFVIIKKTNEGVFENNYTIPISGTVPASKFEWQTDGNELNTTTEIQSNLALKCGFRDKTDIKVSTDDTSFYVQPQQTCYVKANGVKYPAVGDNANLYTFRIYYFKPQFVCPLDSGDGMIYDTQTQCNSICHYQGACKIVKTPLSQTNERIVNNCKDVVLTNGERLADAVQNKQCKLVDEVSLNEDGTNRKTFIQDGILKDPLRDDIGFSESIEALKKENAIGMFGSFLNMIYKGTDENRLTELNLTNQLRGFDGTIKEGKDFDFLPLIYQTKNEKSSVAMAIKISPSLYNSIKNASYSDNQYEILPVMLIVNEPNYAEKDKFLKTYYLINLNSNPSKRYINQGTLTTRVAEITSSSFFNPNNLVFKLSDGTWGMTKAAYDAHSDFINTSKLRYSIIKLNYFLNINRELGPLETNENMQKVYFNLPEDKTVVGVSNFDLLNQSYNDYLTNKNKYYEKDRSFNKYSIKMDTDIKYHTIYLSSLNSIPNSLYYNGFSLIRMDGKYYLDKNNDGTIDKKDSYPVKVNGWYFNMASKTNDPREWKSDFNPIFGRAITEQDVIGSNWSVSGSTDFGGGIYASLNYPVKMKFSWAGDDYHFAAAVFDGDTAVGCKKTSNTINNTTFDCSNPPKTLPYYGNGDLQSRTDYYSESNLINAEGNYFIMFFRDGGSGVDHRDFVRVDFETTSTEPPFKWAIPKNPTWCPIGFTNENGYCYKTNVPTLTGDMGFVPIDEEAGINGYNPNTLSLSTQVDNWKIRKDFNFSEMVKKINIWNDLKEGDVLQPLWLANINFNTFQDGKLFMIIAKKNKMDNILDNIKTNGIDYLISLIENDYNGDKKYFAWNMNDRFKNASIFTGVNDFKGLESNNVNKFIRYFGLEYGICPENFVFNSRTQLCYSNNSSAIATPLVRYFTNETTNRVGPIYASYNKENLIIREVPEVGIDTNASSIICPSGYSYDSSLKECVMYGNVQDCTAPNGSYDLDIRACVAEVSCTHGGSFDANRGKCVKLTPTNYTGRNGYYFMYKKNGSGFDFYTPMSLPEKLKCVYDKYKCSTSGEVYNSKDQCQLLCGGSCNYVEKVDNSEYNDKYECENKCGTHDSSYNGKGTLIISNMYPFNKHSNVTIYKNNSIISNSSHISDNNFYFGTENNQIQIPNVKPGDVITLKITSQKTFDDLHYQIGLGYWDDNLGNRVYTLNTPDNAQCFKLDKYFPNKNRIKISYDVDNDNIPESETTIPTFYCITDDNLTKDIKIYILGDKLKIDYFTTKMESNETDPGIDYFNKGECTVVSDTNSSVLKPYFQRLLNSDFTANINVNTINDYYPENTTKGIKDSSVDTSLIDNFHKAFCYYPYQEQYTDMKQLSSPLKELFAYNKYFGICPSYFDNQKVKLVKLNLSNNDVSKLYELGVQSFNQKITNDTFNPIQIYNILNKQKITTLPLGKGIFINDNLMFEIPHFGRKSVYLGYGYSPFDDCRYISGDSIKTDILYSIKDNCNIPHLPGHWTYNSSIHKCVKAAISGACDFGTYQDGECIVNPVCPSGYIPNPPNGCKKIIVHSYSTNNKVCKLWWTLKRTYTCDGLSDIFSGYIFGLPRWITIKQLPVYHYADYNFSN